MKTAQFDRFAIEMTLTQAKSASHQGDCGDDAENLLRCPQISEQLRSIGPWAIRDELAEYGAWDASDLADDNANLVRIVWIAAGNIVEENQ